MKGYKIFGPNYTCRGYKYSLDNPNIYKEPIELCKTGFHFCKYARDCISYYDINDTNTYAIVETDGNYVSKGDKVVCDRLTIVKQLTKDEFLYYVNNVEYKELHDNGNIFIEYTYGSYKRWYSNGQLAEETTYVNGLKHGCYKEWYENGKLKGEYIFENGKLTEIKKLSLEWYENDK